MFDFDAGKLIIIAIVALIVIGPKELPGVLRQLGQAVGKMRRMATEFQGQFMEAVREADLADVKADVARLAESAKVDVAFNPIADVKRQITGAIDGVASPGSGLMSARDAPAPHPAPHAESSLNSVDLPHLSGTPAEESDTPLALGVAPAAPDADIKPASQAEQPAAAAIDAEMQALASALEAEMRAAPDRQDDGAKTQKLTPQGNA